MSSFLNDTAPTALYTHTNSSCPCCNIAIRSAFQLTVGTYLSRIQSFHSVRKSSLCVCVCVCVRVCVCVHLSTCLAYTRPEHGGIQIMCFLKCGVCRSGAHTSEL